MYRTLTCLIICLLTVSALRAQLLSGTLHDPTGEAIPYANIFLDDESQGVLSDIEGNFYMELKPGSYTLIFQSLGYETKEVSFDIDGDRSLNVIMQPEDVRIETIQITNGRRDPAYAIMEEVIDNKRQYIKQFETMKFQTYLKVVLEADTSSRVPEKKKLNETRKFNQKLSNFATKLRLRDTIPDDTSLLIAVDTSALVLPEIDSSQIEIDSTGKVILRQLISFNETRSTNYFEYPNRYKTIVHAINNPQDRRTGFGRVSWGGQDEVTLSNNAFQYQSPYLFYTNVSEADINFYKNLISVLRIADRPFVSPLSSLSWKTTYKYQLMEQYEENGKIIYRIKVTPRLQEGANLEGYIWIVDKEWAIRAVDFRFSPSALNFFNYFRVRHDYEQIEDGRWVLAEEEYTYNTKMGREYYYGNSLARHSNFRPDREFPRNFFNNEVLRIEEGARKRDSSYWEGIRPTTLQSTELEFLHRRDSIFQKVNSEAYKRERDSIINKVNFLEIYLEGMDFRKSQHGFEAFVDGLINGIRPLGVGGPRYALGGWVSKEFKNYKKVILGGSLDYGRANNDIKGRVYSGFVYNPRHFGKITLRYGNEYVMVNQNSTITAFFARSNFVQKISYGATHEWELFNGVKLDVAADYAERKSISDLTLSEWSEDLFGSDNVPVDFPTYQEAVLDLKLHITPKQKYTIDGKHKIIHPSKWPTITFHYKKAVPGIYGSDLNYDFLEISTQDEFRPGTWGISRWAGAVGRFIQAENLNFTDLIFIRGSDPYLFANPLRNFQLLGPTIATDKAYVRAQLIHDFNGAIADKIPLINRTRLQFGTGGGILLIEDGNFAHAELYAGIQYPFRIQLQRIKFSVNYVTSYTNNADALAGQIKFGLTFYDARRQRWNY